jgi:transcriptional antiterminator Rof (Rho-off)
MAGDSIVLRVRAANRSHALRKATNLLQENRAAAELEIYDRLCGEPEIVEKHVWDSRVEIEAAKARKIVVSLIGKLRSLKAYLAQADTSLRDEDVEHLLFEISLDTRFLRLDHLSAPGRMTYEVFDEDEEDSKDSKKKKVFYVQASRHY